MDPVGPRLYRPVFISSASAANPIEGIQAVEASNDPKAGLITDGDLAKVEQAIRYLNKSEIGRGPIDAGQRAGVKLDINRGAKTQLNRTNNPKDPKYRVIDWDPESQLRLIGDDGHPRDEYQSPALGLGHEYDHFSEAHPDNTEIPLYDTKEEKRVIDGWETPTAEDLGEPTRTNHSGLPYRTDDPTFISGGVFDWENLTLALVPKWKAYFQANPARAGGVRAPLAGR